MQFVKPTPFEEAIEKLGVRSPIGSKLTSAEWSDVPLALRERAFFSSTIESVRFLQRSRDSIMDFLTANREASEAGPMLKTGGRAQFVRDMQAFLAGEGVERTTGGLTDITSQRRLSLIFDTQVRQANDFGYWKQGQDPDVLNEFPAQRFIRTQEVQDPRDWHVQFEGGVWLKTDIDAWIRINQDFGVPWGPWGWGCGHDVEDVDRDEAESEGLVQPGQTIAPATTAFNDRLEASTRGLDRDMLKLLDESFGDQVVIEGDTVRWRGQEALPRVTPPPAPAPSQPRATITDLDDLVGQYRAADFGARRRLAEEARGRLSVPEAERKPVSLTMKTSSGPIRDRAREGASIVSRYTSGVLVDKTKVEVHATKKRRAFHRSGGIYISSSTSSSTAAHEVMHAIEIQNPEVLRASAEFLLRRGAGETPQSLRVLTGHKGYQSDEIAFDDDWAERGGSVYAGKVYSHAGRSVGAADQIRATEVLTMGIERLHADPLEFYTNDRDWFEFVVRTLRKL